MNTQHQPELLKPRPAGKPREAIAAGVAQTAEHPALNRNVVGSIPTARTVENIASFTGASGKRWHR